MQERNWILAGYYWELVAASSISILRMGYIVELRMRNLDRDVYHRTRLFWRQ